MKNSLLHSPPNEILAILVVLPILIFSTSGLAVDRIKLPPINLGSTAFMDGMAGPGTLLQLSANMSVSDSFKNNDGDSLPGNNEIDVSAFTLQIAHITNHIFLNGFYGAEILLPLVDIQADTTLPGLPDSNETGKGDILISPFMLQWTGSKLFDKTYFHRLNLIFSLPTGDYDADNDVNAGMNLVKFNPYYAGTLHWSPKLSTSFRLHYLWNGKNTDPNPVLNAKSIQPGSAFHMNYALSYEVIPNLRLGVAGYYLKQLTADRLDGVRQQDSKERVLSIGPGLYYRSKSSFFNLNSYFESHAINRTEGYRVIMRYARLFG